MGRGECLTPDRFGRRSTRAWRSGHGYSSQRGSRAGAQWRPRPRGRLPDRRRPSCRRSRKREARAAGAGGTRASRPPYRMRSWPPRERRWRARLVGRFRRLMEIVEKKQRLARLGVAKLHAVRVARLRVGDDAFDVESRKLLIRKPEQMPERRRVETDDAEGHGDFPFGFGRT